MNRKFKIAIASVLSLATILSITACDQESGPAITTNADFLPLEEYIDTIVGDYQSKLAGGPNADIKVEKKIKYLGWWAIDETQASAVLFKKVYGIPDANNGNNIFDFTNVAYADRYTQLAKMVLNGDSPDIFQFEIINFPYTAVKKLFQPIDDCIDFSNSLWDKNREVMEQFKWNGQTYCAITTINLDQVLWYRRSEMETNGLTDPYELFKEGKWDWNAFLDMCAQFSDPEKGKYCIDGWQVPDRFVSTTGVPMIGIVDGKLQQNFYNADVERCMTTVIDTMYKQNYRYPRHELNGWSTNKNAWVKGDTLFWADLSNAIKDTFQGEIDRYEWEAGDVFCVPFPKDPNSDKYYQAMKNDSWMLCGGSENKEGFAAWNLCCMATAFDKEAERISKDQIMTNYVGYNDEILEHLRHLQFDGVFTPVFDFKGGIGQDIVDSNTVDNPIDCLTQKPYLNCLDSEGNPATFSSLRAANEGQVNARIEALNDGTLQ